jgi:bla regulator protein blaR1
MNLISGVADHLWQSTLFALCAGLLTLMLRHNQASERYWLWFAASLKFLLPFWLFSALGNQLAEHLDYATDDPWWNPIIAQLTEPFAAQAAGSVRVTRLLGLIWGCGFVAVLYVWLQRWRSVAALARNAVPLTDGPEVQTLRQLQPLIGVARPLRILQSASSLEPGVFGVFKPVLLWPSGISSQLQPAHLRAVIAHELWHVRRRDNLAAAMHMLIVACFWFHPLVWWLGARLMDERERACDEKVLELGSERRTYAESILRTCQFCVGSALPCISGVSGANLKQRIVDIMTRDSMRKLDLRRKALLLTAGAVALIAPPLVGFMSVEPCHGWAYHPSRPPLVLDLFSNCPQQPPADNGECRKSPDQAITLPRSTRRSQLWGVL